MAQIPNRVKNTIDKYLTALSEHNIPIKRALLFGSYANGNVESITEI